MHSGQDALENSQVLKNLTKHTLVKKPDFSLAFSSSGQLLPRRMIHKEVEMHDFST